MDFTSKSMILTFLTFSVNMNSEKVIFITRTKKYPKKGSSTTTNSTTKLKMLKLECHKIHTVTKSKLSRYYERNKFILLMEMFN